MLNFRTAIAEHIIDNIIYINNQENAAFTVSSPSIGIGKSERVHNIKNKNDMPFYARRKLHLV